MGLSHFESVREERTYGARDGPRGPKIIVLLSRTSKGGADKAGYVRVMVRMTVGKKKRGRPWAAISEYGQADGQMIGFLVKICAFLFASAHLSFLPHCQPEQKASIMPSNNERTYIMVKVRSSYLDRPSSVQPC